jgi:hypothetical protein
LSSPRRLDRDDKIGSMADKGINKQLEQASEQLQRLAHEQGVKPFDFDAFLSSPPIGPEENIADEMIQFIYRGRRDHSDRNLP